MKNEYLVLVSENEKEYIDSLSFSFQPENIKIISETITKQDIEELAKTINEKYKKVIVFDYVYEFFELLSIISNKVDAYWIFKYSIACFSNSYLYNYFLQIIEYKKRGIIKEIYTVDYALYTTFNKECNYIKLDIRTTEESEEKNEVGIIGMDYDGFSNFYNSLSACTFYNFERVKVQNTMDVTIDFGKKFNLNIEKYNSYIDIIKNSKVNLYCQFTNYIITDILKSLDMGIPCIVGNTNIFDENKYLKEQLVLKSDDDINEIVKKIENAVKNKERILEEYKEFRSEYSKQSKKIIEEMVR